MFYYVSSTYFGVIAFLSILILILNSFQYILHCYFTKPPGKLIKLFHIFNIVISLTLIFTDIIIFNSYDDSDINFYPRLFADIRDVIIVFWSLYFCLLKRVHTEKSIKVKYTEDDINKIYRVYFTLSIIIIIPFAIAYYCSYAFTRVSFMIVLCLAKGVLAILSVSLNWNIYELLKKYLTGIEKFSTSLAGKKSYEIGLESAVTSLNGFYNFVIVNTIYMFFFVIFNCSIVFYIYTDEILTTSNYSEFELTTPAFGMNALTMFYLFYLTYINFRTSSEQNMKDSYRSLKEKEKDNIAIALTPLPTAAMEKLPPRISNNYMNSQPKGLVKIFMPKMDLPINSSDGSEMGNLAMPGSEMDNTGEQMCVHYSLKDLASSVNSVATEEEIEQLFSPFFEEKKEIVVHEFQSAQIISKKANSTLIDIMMESEEEMREIQNFESKSEIPKPIEHFKPPVGRHVSTFVNNGPAKLNEFSIVPIISNLVQVDHSLDDPTTPKRTSSNIYKRLSESSSINNSSDKTNRNSIARKSTSTPKLLLSNSLSEILM